MFKKVNRQFSIDRIAFPLDRFFEPDYVFPGESHNFTELVYVDSGRVEAVENEKVYIMNAGDILFHAPGEFHAIRSADHTSPRVINLSAIISGEVPQNLYGGVFCLAADERDSFLDIFNSASAYIKGAVSHKFAGQETADRLAAFIMRICRTDRRSDNLSSDPAAVAYKSIVRTMRDELYTNISLEELAKKNNISVSYVKMLFRRYAGRSPKSCYRELRANEAARLVLEGLPKAEIAERMGFSSPNYFTMFFKNQMGETPSEYKKKRTGGAGNDQ